MKEIEKLIYTKPKDLWKLFVTRKSHTNDIPLSDLYDLFSTLQAHLGNIFHHFNGDDCCFDDLDGVFFYPRNEVWGILKSACPTFVRPSEDAIYYGELLSQLC